MSHDFIAELGGYRNELARYTRAGDTGRADAVREQMAKVVTAIGVEVDRLDAVADNHMTAGQDLLAARATIEARRLRAALAELGTAAEQGEQETAADATPRETAVNRKRGIHA
jgi:hypothetical protein